MVVLCQNKTPASVCVVIGLIPGSILITLQTASHVTRRRRNYPTKQQQQPSVPAKQQGDGSVTHQLRQSSFSGPVPHPDILLGYNEIVPDAAERILRMAEQDAEHQRNIEMTALKAAASETKRGQIFGLLIGLSALIVSGAAAYLGQTEVAMMIGGTTVVGLVTVFVVGRWKQQEGE